MVFAERGNVPRRQWPLTWQRILHKLAFAKVYERKTPLTAADLLNDRVVAFFEEHEIPRLQVLTNRGTGGCGTPERHIEL